VNTNCLVKRKVWYLLDLTEVLPCGLNLTRCPHALTHTAVFHYALSLSVCVFSSGVTCLWHTVCRDAVAQSVY